MIVVKIELVSANTGRTEEIGRMVIANEDSTGGDPTRGNYRAKLGRRGLKAVTEGTRSEEVWTKPQKEAAITDYPRLTYSVWVLVARALKALGQAK